jgi:adenosylcobyric acid synthase
MGLLPVHTRFQAEKHRSRVSGCALSVSGVLQPLTGAALEGYEIHMGQTLLGQGAAPLLRLDNAGEDGCCQGNVYGSYLHGFFDAAQCRQAVLSALCQRKGVRLDSPVFDWDAYRNRQYDSLAQGIRRGLNMDLIYQILEEGV